MKSLFKIFFGYNPFLRFETTNNWYIYFFLIKMGLIIAFAYKIAIKGSAYNSPLWQSATKFH